MNKSPRDLFRERPRDPGALRGHYNRNYWHAVVAQMGGGDFDPLFAETFEFGDLTEAPHMLAAFYFRGGETVEAIADALMRHCETIFAWLDSEREKFRRVTEGHKDDEH